MSFYAPFENSMELFRIPERGGYTGWLVSFNSKLISAICKNRKQIIGSHVIIKCGENIFARELSKLFMGNLFVRYA